MNSEDSNINFLKLNTENNAVLIEDLDLEQLDLKSSISPYETANIDGMLLKSFKSVLHIPTYQDLLKVDIEQAKFLSKLINADKNNIINLINRLLSIDFRGRFIFSQKNLNIICNILIFILGELKKYKISTYVELENKIRAIDFSKYDFNKSYLKEEYVKKRSQSVRNRDARINTAILSRLSVKELDEDWTEIDDTNINYENKNYGIKKGIPYIDIIYENYIYSSLLTKDYNYDEEQTFNKLLTYKCFQFQKPNKDEADLPIELMILLYKLKDVKTLIFQIKNASDQFIKMSLFILMNIKWLFLYPIEEIKFDLNDDELQKKLYIEFNKRASELYEDHGLPKLYTYFSGHSSRKYNFWSPEGDIIFEKVSFNKLNNYIFSHQSDLEYNTFDETLCNIYNEFGFITNFKYIRPIIYTIQSIDKKNEFLNEQGLNREEDESLDYYHNNSVIFTRNEKKFNHNNPSINNMRNSNSNVLFKSQKENANEKTTTDVIKDFVKNNTNSFQLMSLFFYFLTDFRNLKKFSIYFDFSHSLEIQYMFSLSNAIYDRFHFLIFANNINTLTEASFSFNSLDSNAFENILGIIKKNKNLTSLKMSLFSQEIIYNENNLLYLWSEKKLGLNKLFKEQKEFLIKTNGDMERNLAYFILHHNKILENFTTNIKNLFNLLQFESLKTLEEIIFRFDIPLQILMSEKYKYILVKFILNLFIALSLQPNKVKTFKILAPELPFDANQIPLIQQLFHELKEEEEHIEPTPDKKINKNSKIQEKINMLQNAINKKTMSSESNSSLIRASFKNNHNTNGNSVNENNTLEDLTLNLKFYNLPEIFNIIYINNLEKLKKINLGFLDEITFISFMNGYKNNSENMKGLSSLKISLCPSVISYQNIEQYILQYINIDPPNLEEKYLFSNLKIDTEEKMNELIDNVYYIAKVSKLVVEIGNDNNNVILLENANKKLIEDREGMYTLRMIMDLPKYEKIRVQNIIDTLSSFYCKKHNRMVICKENPSVVN